MPRCLSVCLSFGGVQNDVSNTFVLYHNSLEQGGGGGDGVVTSSFDFYSLDSYSDFDLYQQCDGLLAVNSLEHSARCLEIRYERVATWKSPRIVEDERFKQQQEPSNKKGYVWQHGGCRRFIQSDP